jgi:hypothetical protein
VESRFGLPTGGPTTLYATRTGATTYALDLDLGSGLVGLGWTFDTTGFAPLTAVGMFGDARGAGRNHWASISMTPEPTSMVLMGLGGVMLLQRRRRR